LRYPGETELLVAEAHLLDMAQTVQQAVGTMVDALPTDPYKRGFGIIKFSGVNVGKGGVVV